MALCLYIPSTARTMEPSGPRKAKPVPITVMHVVMATSPGSGFYQQICSFQAEGTSKEGDYSRLTVGDQEKSPSFVGV